MTWADLRPVNPALHPGDACALCGSTENLRPTLIPATMAEASVCVNVIVCLRRRRDLREAELIGGRDRAA